MNRDAIRQKCLFGVLSALLICSGISCTGADATDMEILRRKQFVDEDVFLSITNGTSLADVKMKLGPAVRHQFTAVEGGHTWTLIRCFLHTGEEEGYNFYQPLFRDGELVKTIGWIRMEREEVPYKSRYATSMVSRTTPWDIEDPKYVQKAIETPEVTHEQIRAQLKDAQATMEKYKGQGNIPRVVGYLFAPAFRALEKKGYPVNEELRRKFDGCRVSIGMTGGEVDAIYGKPLHTYVTKHGKTARIYGDDRYLGNAVDAFLVFSDVAVLLDATGHVESVYSDVFFCKDWYPNLPVWRRD